jgi:hypothetical protein
VPTPDVSATVDLTVFDSTASEYADRAAANVETVLPEAALPLGSLEMVLIESLAILVAELGYALNRIPGAVLESLLTRLYAIGRSPGVLPTAAVQITVAADGASVPVGTLVQLTIGDEVVQFTTDAELSVVAGVPTAVVGITGTEFTDLANGTVVGTPVDLVTDTTGVTAAVLSQAVGGGAGPEDADAYLDRAGIRLQRLTDTLVMPAQFEAFALEQPGIYRAKAVNNYNSATALAANGHISIAVLDSAGALLSAGAKTALATLMDDIALANLGVHVFDPTITAVAVTATVHVVAGADTAAVQAACVAALDAYLSPLAWGWGAMVRRNELIALLEAVPGVDYLTAGHPTAPAADVALTGQAPLADAGALTITAV